MEQLVREIIENQVGPVFDSHDVILLLAQQNQRWYVEELNRMSGDAPFQTLHSQIGKMIERLSPEFHLTGAGHVSDDIFRQPCSCMQWTRT
ncbi:MAG: hypothetical protein JNM63_02510 [Spirochaetia bacterium]|nr:hypothetical protein [Spirochaetia bacterium]